MILGIDYVQLHGDPARLGERKRKRKRKREREDEYTI